jgi:glucose uptake protein GlcU
MAFDPTKAPITRGIASIGAGTAFPETAVAQQIHAQIAGYTLAEWASLIAIIYGLVCLFIALPKIVYVVQWTFRFMQGKERRVPFLAKGTTPRRRQSDKEE